MDTTLAHVASESHLQSPVFVASILKSVLGAFSELETECLVYTGATFTLRNGHAEAL
jgi:hypothetical protein